MGCHLRLSFDNEKVVGSQILIDKVMTVLFTVKKFLQSLILIQKWCIMYVKSTCCNWQIQETQCRINGICYIGGSATNFIKVILLKENNLWSYCHKGICSWCGCHRQILLTFIMVSTQILLTFIMVSTLGRVWCCLFFVLDND